MSSSSSDVVVPVTITLRDPLVVVLNTEIHNQREDSQINPASKILENLTYEYAQKAHDHLLRNHAMNPQQPPYGIAPLSVL